MDNNYFNEMLPQLNNNPFTMQYYLGTTVPLSISFDITLSMEIIPGFVNTGELPLLWKLSMDQHLLRFYITEQITQLGNVEYVLKLVGLITYNAVFTGLKPMDPLVSTSGGAVFNNYGSYQINELIGVYDNIQDIQNIILTDFSIVNILNQGFVITSAGEVVPYNPANPGAFNDAITGRDYVRVGGNYTVIITFIQDPVS